VYIRQEVIQSSSTN